MENKTIDVGIFLTGKIATAREKAIEVFGEDAWEIVVAQTALFNLKKMVEAQLVCLGLHNLNVPIITSGERNLKVVYKSRTFATFLHCQLNN